MFKIQGYDWVIFSYHFLVFIKEVSLLFIKRILKATELKLISWYIVIWTVYINLLSETKRIKSQEKIAHMEKLSTIKDTNTELQIDFFNKRGILKLKSCNND